MVPCVMTDVSKFILHKLSGIHSYYIEWHFIGNTKIMACIPLNRKLRITPFAFRCIIKDERTGIFPFHRFFNFVQEELMKLTLTWKQTVFWVSKGLTTKVSLMMKWYDFFLTSFISLLIFSLSFIS